MEENKKLKYESPHVSVRRMISESGLLVGSGYTPEKKVSKMTLGGTLMQFDEGGNYAFDSGENPFKFENYWEEE